jgi:hypothetical protein
VAITLHLGVVDVPYVQRPTSRRRRTRAGTVTTGDVAGWLENRYHILENFVELHTDDVAKDLEGSLAGALESLLMGAPVSINAFGGAESKIEERMKQFLALGEMEKIGYPGVPTQAALDRRAGRKRSARFKRKRPGTGVSFIDSGLMQSSYKAWMTT